MMGAVAHRVIGSVVLVTAATFLVLTPPVVAGRPAPLLPAGIPEPERVRLQAIADGAAVSTRVDAEPFMARRDIFEYLLDHPEFATHVTRALKLARYRIWRTPDGLFLDDGWGTSGRFGVVHAAGGIRVMYARGEYQQKLLPSIRGEAVVVIEYGTGPAADGRARVSTAVTGFVKLDSRVLTTASKLATSVAQAKADKEAHKLMKVFARTTRAIEDNPADVYDRLRQRPDVPPNELEEFRRLLSLH